ncbi:AAA family ATPase [Luteimonas sp. SMYT11W]|uniref:AAA family ATPase n=1 Tax=Luteimonas flava TaxID=3115822 RepID=A0ABU7WF12_9GAMM
MSSGPSRVQGDPVVGQLNDFGVLLGALYARRAQLAAALWQQSQAGVSLPTQPQADALTILKNLWEKIFPERELLIEDHVVLARQPRAQNTYPASRLSDGERVGFYLIGHALLAPENALIVIDEPELHLHPSIHSLLWDTLEAVRPDASFVYITHDLSFAASRVNASIVVLYDYEASPPVSNTTGVYMGSASAHVAGRWVWDEAPSIEDVHADLVLKVMGARRQALFVEGTAGSYDVRIFEILFPERYVVPGGNCEQVEKTVRGLRAHPALHRVDAAGIIDRDDRSSTLVDRLRKNCVYPLPVAAVENLLVVPDCLSAYMTEVSIPVHERDARIADACDRIRRSVSSSRAALIAERAQYEVRRKIRAIRREGDSLSALKQATTEAIAAADPVLAYSLATAQIDSALDLSAGLMDILRTIRDKGIVGHVAAAFSSDKDSYVETVTRLLASQDDLRRRLRVLLAIP